MRITAPTQADAQAIADRVHAFLIATDTAYAESVAQGHTLRWAIPTQDQDANGNPVGDWFIPVEPRCVGALSADELLRVDPPLSPAAA